MQDDRHPFYYHLGDASIDNLRVNVTLRRVRDGWNQRRTVRWQEKIRGPVVEETQQQRSRGDRRRRAKDGSAEALREQGAVIFTHVDGECAEEADHNCPHGNPGRSIIGGVLRSLNHHRRSGAASANALSCAARSRREDPVKRMHIMAAVDCSDRQGREVDSEIDSSSSKMNVHQELLCSIVLHASSRQMVVTPGFSVEEPEDEEDNAIFAASSGMDLRRSEGVRITTFRFSTPDGSSIYEYSVESSFSSVLHADRVEQLVMEENKRDLEKMIELQVKRIPSNMATPITAQMNDDIPFQLHAFIELVSAQSFGPNVALVGLERLLCVDYDVSLPQGWQSISCDEDASCPRSEDGNCVLSGSTQLSAPTYNTGTYSYQSIGIYESKTVAGIPILLVSVLFLVFLGETLWYYSWSMLLAFTFPMIMTSFTGGCAAIEEDHQKHPTPPTYHFGIPIDLHLLPPKDLDSDPARMNSKPRILLQVSSTCSYFGRRAVEGYGYFDLPYKCGCYDINVNTWKPVGGGGNGEIRTKMHDYYVNGGASHVSLPDILQFKTLEGRINGFQSKLGLVTESAGNLRLRMHVLECDMSKPFHQPKYDETCNPTMEAPTHPLTTQESIAEVLARVRRNRIERKIRGISTRHRLLQRKHQDLSHSSVHKSGESETGSPPKDASLGPNARTAEVLARIRARREERKKNVGGNHEELA